MWTPSESKVCFLLLQNAVGHFARQQAVITYCELNTQTKVKSSKNIMEMFYCQKLH
jgi:hypothetical protein